MRSFLSRTLTLIGLCWSLGAASQQTIDQSVKFPPGSGITHKYGIYIPTGYSASVPSKLIVGFHPLGLGTWNSRTWRDTLISFAELTNCIVFCPDGGTDGRVDDPEDYAFTLAYIDSMIRWYNIDDERIFCLGYSEGGKAVYEFSLANHSRIRGAIPIGAAIDGITSFKGNLNRARCRNFYLVHGDKDSPNTRYYPVKTALESNDGHVDGLLMAGIGHTINFPSRNTILKLALTFVDTSSCDFTGTTVYRNEHEVRVFPNPVSGGKVLIQTKADLENPEVRMIHVNGKQSRMEVEHYPDGWFMKTAGLLPGIYLLTIQSGENRFQTRLVVQ